MTTARKKPFKKSRKKPAEKSRKKPAEKSRYSVTVSFPL